MTLVLANVVQNCAGGDDCCDALLSNGQLHGQASRVGLQPSEYALHDMVALGRESGRWLESLATLGEICTWVPWGLGVVVVVVVELTIGGSGID